MPRKKKRKKQRIVAPVKSLRGLEVRYQRELNKLGKALVTSVRKEVLEYLKANQKSYVADGVGSQLNTIFRRLNGQFTGTAVASFAELTSAQMVERVGAQNKKRFEKSVAKSVGVDFTSILQTEGLEDFIELSISKNTSLIKSLPEQYLTNVETIVNNEVVSGARYSTIEKEIISKTGADEKLFNRIKVIARNEVSTINSQITLRRSESLGITEGIFRTSQDERVRPCHKELNGVRYKLAKGAWSKTCQKFIQPGVTDISCRCTFSPVIEVD